LRIIGLISWWDEKADWLGAAVASMAPFIDHVVAVDGAYAHYPGGKGQSPTGQAEAIRETARACRIGCSIHEPQERWGGNEIEKRAFLFHAGELVSQSQNDWYFILDGDELVTEVTCEVRKVLMDSDHDVGRVTCWTNRDHLEPRERSFLSETTENYPIRKFCRAIPGLTVVENHYTYVTPDGRYLMANSQIHPEEQPEELAIKVEHRNRARDLKRNADAKAYYDRREELGLEGPGPEDE
jgi:hypothetical protein